MTQSIEELVYTKSDDGLPLEGAVIRPAGPETKPIAVVWVHGLTSKFYSAAAVGIGRALAGHGFTFVTGNNRGHDFGYVIRRTDDGQPLLGGGGWELFDESPRDVAAWVELASGLGVRGVLLVGHSLGALKVGYYQTQRHDERVLGLVAASAPLAAGLPDPRLVDEAERMEAEGRGNDLLPWSSTHSGAGTMSAQSYLNRARTGLDVYGFHTASPTTTAPISQVRCAVFACYGTNEPTVGGRAQLDLIWKNARNASRVETRLFRGADHSYVGHEVEIAATFARWAESL